MSLGLTFLTHAVAGWQVASWDSSWSAWLMVAILILLVTWGLTTPFNFFNNFFSRWLQSDAQTLVSFSFLILVVIGVLLLTWIFLFVKVLLMICAGILASLSLQEVGYKKWRSFLLLTLLSWAGYSVGLVSYQLMH